MTCECNNETLQAGDFMAKVKKGTAVVEASAEATSGNVVDLLGLALAQLDTEQAALTSDDPAQLVYRNCRSKLHAVIEHIQYRLYGGH